MAIIGGLLALAAPRYFQHIDRTKETVLKSDLAGMRDALDKFFADTGRYPANLDELVARRYLRKVPPDPITETSASWLVVAPADPKLGGVYDVKSGAAGVTLDGRPYGEL
jgi:general secretion pathway protein G